MVGIANVTDVAPPIIFGITLSSEYFDNEKGVVGAPVRSIYDFTFSPNFKFGNLTVIHLKVSQ
ncbi:MAG: hypothetical protein ABI288_07135 [Ginsengibacter sp.]